VAEFDIDQEDVAEEKAELKRRTGKDITILGSGTLVQPLLADDLLDELSLMVQPVVLGSGKRHFEEGSDQEHLEVLDSRMCSIGVL
jgi:dihydrofolate reductase